MARRFVLLFLAALLAAQSACYGGYRKYSAGFFDYFDTYTNIIAYARSQAEFETAAKAVLTLIENDGKLFDIYNDYAGINNIKTINDNAGLAPVPVDAAILDLLEFSAEAYGITGGKVNAAMGPVLRVWHEYRIQGMGDTSNARLPPMETLRKLLEDTGIENLIIDRQAGTAFLARPGMSLDVGALAKGFTLRRALEAAREAGLESALINIGGEIAALGSPMDSRDHWAVGVQDPFGEDGARGIMDTVHISGMALASSGDYQRFYTVEGVNYGHIIDPETLMPATRFTQVTVLHPDAGMAEILSTAIFILPLDEGRDLLRQNGADGLWITPDGSVEATPGFAAVSQNLAG